MAESGKIDKNTLVTEGALKIWEELAGKIKIAEVELEKIIKSGGKLKGSIGSSGTMKDINTTITKLGTNIKNLEKAQKSLVDTNKKLTDSNKKITDSSKKVTGSSRKQETQTKKLTDSRKKLNATRKTSITGIKTLMQNLGVLIGMYIGFTSVMRVFRSVFDITKTLDSLRFATQNIITDTKEYAETQAFLNRIVEAYGLELFDATRSYIKFRAAVGATNLTVAAGRKIFESFAKAGSILGLRADEMNGVFLALEQMISKGKVTTEELRRQLGERIPGAFNIMANAIGVSVSELDDLLRKGKILAEDALPKMAAELEKTFGIENVTRVDTLVAAQERLTTSWRKFVRELQASEKFINMIENLNIALVAVGKQFGFFLPTAEKGMQRASEHISRMTDNSKTAEEELTKVKNAYFAVNEEIKQQETLLKNLQDELDKPRAFGRDTDFKKSPFGSRSDMFDIRKEGEATLASLKAQSQAYYDHLAGGIEGIKKNREEENEAAVKEDKSAWLERLAIFKANQNTEFASYKEHLETMRAHKEQTMRDNGATELEIDRALSAHKIDLETDTTNFRVEQMDDLLDFVKGHARETATTEETVAELKATLAKKVTAFKISEGGKEHALYLQRMREKADIERSDKDAQILAIEEKLNAQLKSLQFFATIQSQFAKIGGQQELIDSSLATESFKATMAAMDDLLDIEDLTADEILSIRNRLLNAIKGIESEKRNEYQRTADEQRQLEQASLDLGIQAMSDVFSHFSGFQNAKMEQLEWDKERELNLAGDSVAGKIAVENEFSREKRKLQRRQAITDKAQAAFSVILDTIKGVMSALANVITAPLAPWIAGLGAVNLAGVLATPLPKFEKGGFHEGGPAIFSEGGKSELFIPETGIPILTPSKETTANMPAGTFIPHAETQRILAQSAISNFVSEVQDIDLNTTNSILRQIASQDKINIYNGFKITNKSNIFGRYVTRE